MRGSAGQGPLNFRGLDAQGTGPRTLRCNVRPPERLQPSLPSGTQAERPQTPRRARRLRGAWVRFRVPCGRVPPTPAPLRASRPVRKALDWQLCGEDAAGRRRCTCIWNARPESAQGRAAARTCVQLGHPLPHLRPETRERALGTRADPPPTIPRAPHLRGLQSTWGWGARRRAQPSAPRAPGQRPARSCPPAGTDGPRCRPRDRRPRPAGPRTCHVTRPPASNRAARVPALPAWPRPASPLEAPNQSALRVGGGAGARGPAPAHLGLRAAGRSWPGCEPGRRAGPVPGIWVGPGVGVSFVA